MRGKGEYYYDWRCVFLVQQIKQVNEINIFWCYLLIKMKNFILYDNEIQQYQCKMRKVSLEEKYSLEVVIVSGE